MPILSIGEEIRNTYDVERFLGAGAFAEVYRVKHRYLQRREALKLFKSPSDSFEHLNARLEEGRVLSALEHPNIVRIFDANLLTHHSADYGFFTMEYVAGGTLERYWRGYGTQFMPVEEATEIISQVCKGLSAAHTKSPPLVHRDVKPQNILIGFDGAGLRVRVSDFGLAKIVDEATLMATARGTLAFKPPEALGNEEAPASDTWAIGTTLHMLLTDRLPFPDLHKRTIRSARKLVSKLRPPNIYNISVDEELSAIVMKSLASRPRDRYRNAGEMLTDLEDWKVRRNPSTSREGRARRGRYRAKKKSRVNESSPSLVEEAMALARDGGQLDEAADLLEQAITTSPDLHRRYGYRLALWRKGVFM